MNKKVLILLTLVVMLMMSGNVYAAKVGDVIEKNKMKVVVNNTTYDTNKINTYKKISAVDSKGNATYFRTMVNLEQFCKETKICQAPMVFQKGKSYMIYSYPKDSGSGAIKFWIYYMFIHEIGGKSFTKAKYKCTNEDINYFVSYNDFKNNCQKISSEGVPTTVDVASEWHDGKPFVPGRFLAEAFDYSVAYDQKSSTMKIMSGATISGK